MPTLRVLLVDGDNPSRSSAQRALTRQGYFVIPAATGTDALTLLTQDQVDVIVTQVALPENDSLEIIRAAHLKSPPPPVILLASAKSVNEAMTGVREGAFDYLLTPIEDMTRLAGLIDRAAPRREPPPTPPNGQVPQMAPSPPRDEIFKPFLDAATAGADLNQLLSLFVSQVAQLAHAAQAILLLTSNDTELHIEAWHGFLDKAEAGRFYVQSVGEEVGWEVAGGRDLVWRQVAGEEQDVLSAHQEYLALPLRYQEHILGSVIALPAGPREIVEESSLESIRRFGQQAALALELSHAEKKAAAFNPVDTVTGLLTRDQFFYQADREFRRSWRYQQPIAAMRLDIDDFSRYHALLGANAGDEVMNQVATACAPRIRNVDVIGRLGHDSFGVVLVMATRVNALKVGERLRRLIAEIEITTEDDTWQVTASIGIATYPRAECTSVQDLFALADKATKAAKKAGRNRVEAV